MNEIRLARSDAEILQTYNLMAQLHERVRKSEPADYLNLVRAHEKNLGYQMSYLREEEEIVCVAGFRVCCSMGWGRFLYVDDLVTEKLRRSSGAGRTMFAWLADEARRRECEELRLDCRLDRTEAHRFYFRERMEIRCFHFSLVVKH
jgi:GNAT superfamily N-acetyltransferase